MLRRATENDIPTLVEGNCRLAQETEDLTLDRDTVTAGVTAAMSGEQPGLYYVREIEGQVVAQLMVTFEWSDWRNAVVWWIQSVYVWPEHRRQGHFEALYEGVKAAAQAAGAGGLRLYVDTTNTRAQKVYEHVGMNGDHYRLYETMFK